MATITKRKKKIGFSYQVQLRTNGHYISKTFNDLRSAKYFVHTTESKLMQNSNLNLSGVSQTLKQLIYKYIEDFVVLKKTKKTEINRWKFIIRNYPKLVETKVSNLSPQHFITFKNQRMAHGRRTTNYDLTMFHVLFEKAMKVWLLPIPLNPVTPIEKLPLDKGRYRPITPNEYIRILRFSKSKSKEFYLIILVLKNTGIRPNELLNLKFIDIDENKHVIVVRKSKTYNLRVVPINNYLIKKIKLFGNLNDNSKIFNLSKWGLNSKWMRMCSKLNIINLQLYDFRRSFARRYIDNHKGDIPSLAKIGGWSSWDMVQRYYGKSVISN